MSIPKLYSFRKLKRKAEQQGISWIPRKGKGGHGSFEGSDNFGNIHTYPLPGAQHKKEVTRIYLKGFLRRFGLNEDFLDD